MKHFDYKNAYDRLIARANMTNKELMEQWLTQEATTKIEIFVDLDGVLVDFEKKALEIAGYLPEYSTDPTKKKLRGDFWKMIAVHVKKGNKFFEEMHPMEDAHVLWDYIKHREPTICSATGHIRGAKEEKREWVRKNLGEPAFFRAQFVRDASQKGQHALPGRVLIDDRQKALDSFIAAGGMGILHTSAASTIAQLKELGL